MTVPVSNINRANLNLLDPNLLTGQVADPALRKACFDEIYNYFDTFVTAYNLFIANGGILTANIADLAVTTAKLALGAVTAAQIASGTITTNQIASGAVTSANILDGTLVDADVNAAAAIAWTKVNKALSSLADLAVRSATDLTSGTLNVARLPVAIPATSIGNGDVSNAILSLLNSLSSNAQTQLDAKVPLTQKGIANGVASLDSGAKVPVAQLPDAVLGALEYQGTWNASTNTPTLASPTTVKGYYYVVNVAGTQFSISFDIGDWVVSNGTAWQKIDNTDAVPTVFGRTGNVVSATNDYTWAQIDKTTSSLGDLTTKSASDLSSGTLADARRNARTGDVTSPSGSGVNTIAPSAVTTAKIADLNVTTAKIADLGVTTGKIADLGVTTAKIADLNVTTGKVADGAITSAKLDPSINVAGIPLATHIAANPIDHPDGSITPAKLSFTPENLANKNAVNGYAGLDGAGKVSASQLPSASSVSPATLVVAASNSKNTARADYVCTGTNDQTIINNAITALGTTGGKIVLLEGLFSITGNVLPTSNITIEGQGNSTILRIPNANNGSFAIILNSDTTNGNNNITLSNFMVDGNRANQTAGSVSGIGFVKVSNSTIQTVTVVNCRTNNGIFLSTSTNNQIVGNTIKNCGSTGSTTGGILLQATSKNNIVSYNVCQDNINHGINIDNSFYNTVIGNMVTGNQDGISIGTSVGTTLVSGNVCQLNRKNGIYIGGTDNTITGNLCVENSQTTTATSDNIVIWGNTNNVQGNTCRRGALTNMPRYGIRVDTGATGNLVTNNDLTTGGTTGAFSDVGTSTITTAGNKLA